MKLLKFFKASAIWKNFQTTLEVQMDIGKIVYLNWGEKFKDMIDNRNYPHNLRSCEIKAWKKTSGLNGIRVLDLCDTGAVLYQLSWELAHVSS